MERSLEIPRVAAIVGRPAVAPRFLHKMPCLDLLTKPDLRQEGRRFHLRTKSSVAVALQVLHRAALALEVAVAVGASTTVARAADQMRRRADVATAVVAVETLRVAAALAEQAVVVVVAVAAAAAMAAARVLEAVVAPPQQAMEEAMQ